MVAGRESVARGAVLRTRRLALREIGTGDLDFVAAMLADEAVMRFYPSPLDRAGAAAWIDRQTARYERDGFGLWLAERLDDGAPVGQIGPVLQHVDGCAVIEIGYLLHRPFWGLGFATEAAAGARDHAFASLGADHVVSLIRPVNAPSGAVARRLGMRVTGRTVHHGFEHDVHRVDA